MKKDRLILGIKVLIFGLIFAGLLAGIDYMNGNSFSPVYFIFNTVLYGSLTGFGFELWYKGKKRNKS